MVVEMKNPLIKRIPRELIGEWRKYLVVSLFLILTIGFVSGMYVANESMMIAADEGVVKYKFRICQIMQSSFWESFLLW